MLSRLRIPAIFLSVVASMMSAETAPQALQWPVPTRDQKPWTRWWWPASAVDKENLTRELEAFAAAGLGGVEITPIYGAKGQEGRFIDYLSPHYVEMLAHTTAEANRLGLAVDMATGTGWPFGGPTVTSEDAELELKIVEGKLTPVPTDFKVKRAAPGGAGPVLNPYSAEAMTRYLGRFTETLSGLPAGAIHGQFHDSFEYKANWSAEVPKAFFALHGYELDSQMDAFLGKGDPDTVARVKSDFREVLASLHMEYVRTWIEWTHQQGSLARNQAHGAPANLLDLYAATDVPETEVFGSTEFPIPGFSHITEELSYNHTQPLVNRFASSAAHVTGKPLISSETFTWLREHFHETPSVMKPELDQLLLTGINHVFYHGACYSPVDVAWPGWVFYASTQLNPRNPLWRDMGDGLNAYITRCQSMLQAGKPDNDLLVYWPIYDLYHSVDGWERRFSMHGKDWLTDTSTGKLAQSLVDRGYGFDFVSDKQIADAAVKDHAVVTSGGARYRAVVVPQSNLMPVETLARLLALADEGATVIFVGGLPKDVPGLAQLEKRRAKFAALQRSVKFVSQKNADVGIASRRAGTVLTGAAWEPLLDLANVRREPLVDAGLRFIRRAQDGGAQYFIVNQTGQAFDGKIDLMTPAKSAVLLDPRSERTGVALSWLRVRTSSHGVKRPRYDDHALSVRLQLAPGESIFVQTYAQGVNGDAWLYHEKAGEPKPVAGEWKVEFVSGGPELPTSFATTALGSWTERGGETERFAGTARYTTQVTMDTPADDWLLDLGDVRETARVFVNGQQVDLLWSLPYRTRIGAHLKPGNNVLAVEVTNLAANRIRDLDARKVAWKNFYEINFVNAQYKRFDASGFPLKPSGLLGPVTITPLHLAK